VTIGLPAWPSYFGTTAPGASVAFAVILEGEPPAAIPGTDPPRVTYGPTPPDTGVTVAGYPPGENCAFSRTTDGVLTARLAQLSTSASLLRLAPSTFTDGPWCPDAASPNRYDADLLRIRQIVMTVRVEAAVAALRGPAGPLFTRSGTGRGTRLVPDRMVRVSIAPRALNATR
jgi:hypothetical protein